MKISSKFSPGYVGKVFALWYDLGKPPATKFYPKIPKDNFGDKPPFDTYVGWVSRDEWKERAELLDREVQEHFLKAQVQSKVEMFERHAEVGREMQTMSLKWLREHKDELTPGTAVRLLVDGIEVEQAVAGIPDALKKLTQMKDEDLKDEIAQLLADTPVDATV